MGANDCRFAEEYEGWLGATRNREKHGKVRVGRHDHTLFKAGSFQNHRIVCGMQIVVANVNGIVPIESEKARHSRGDRVVDQKPHAVRGSARSRSMADAAAKWRHSRMSSR